MRLNKLILCLIFSFVLVPLAQAQNVSAQMFLKSKTPQPGYVYHEAEGKQFYIRPVQEQTFYPGEDSYHQMHHHGVAFESEIMGYRIYFDKKQTIDVYAKRTPRLELDACKWYPTEEQLADGFGDDILRVSGYIGVGACKPYNGNKMVHFEDVLSRTQRIVRLTEDTASVEVVSNGFLLPDSSRIDITTRYTIAAGHRDVEVEVFVPENEVQHLKDLYIHRGFCLCTGVQKVGTPCYQTLTSSSTAVGSWGTDWPVNDTIRYAKETCGLGVMVPNEYVLGVTDDKNNRLVLLRPAAVIRYRFTVVSLKENNPPAHHAEEFWAFLKDWLTINH